MNWWESGMLDRRISWGAVLGAALVLAGCGDPLSNVQRYSDVPVASVGQADALAPETARAPVTEAAPRQGLLGFLGRRAAAAKAEPPVADAAPQADADSREPLLEVVAAPAPGAEETTGLFGRSGPQSRAPRPGAPDAREIPFGTTLPYGAIARVCGVPRRQLGKKIASYPERGSRYLVYDSNPGSTEPHSFYLTGFDDGCARQFTAALVLLGTPESYEQIHYGLSGDTQPVSDTDRAYEKVKSRVCKVRKGRPCGAQMRKLSRDTVFVSVYERFGSNARWKNILLHDGEVVAMDMKD
jgi:hypothetical protein